MESSRRAVEAYRRTRLIDAVTSDDDKVAPVYKLDEIASVLQSSSHAVVHEMAEYIFRRVEHKNPVVKQKALRLIKFIVGKAGSEFRREVQRQSAAIRQLFHYRGQPDPLKGDSLNKAVRDTAHEAIRAIFSEEKPAGFDDTRRRIEGFGNTNFDARMAQEKKTLLGEVVDIGAASIKQGLSIISNHYNQFSNTSSMKSGNHGSYEAPSLRRSITDRNSDYPYRESRNSYAEPAKVSYETSTNLEAEVSGSDSEDPKEQSADGGSFEENLLNGLTLLGGVRLQPSRDSLQTFLTEAQRSKPERLYSAFESRLQVRSWQVRLKTLCFLEAVLRQRELRPFGQVALLFEQNSACVADCAASPQTSLRDKAKKVQRLLLNEEPSQNGEKASHARKPAPADLPDLMDTSEPPPSASKPVTGTNGLDLLAELASEQGASLDGTSDDPFAGMAIHNTGDSQDSLLEDEVTVTTAANGSSTLFEGLSVEEEKPASEAETLADLLMGLAVESNSQFSAQVDLSPGFRSSIPAISNVTSLYASSSQAPPLQETTGFKQQQQMFFNPGMGMGSSAQPGIVLQQQQQAFAQSYPMFSQQQQQQQNAAFGFTGSTGGFDYHNGFDFSSNSNIVVRKEETQAFNFISDHVEAARKK